MLIDEFMPKFDVRESHQISVAAPLADVYQAARVLDISRAAMTRWLFRLRGIPVPPRFTLDDFLRMSFILLGERPNEEVLLGLAGQFWRPSGKLRRLNTAGFRSFHESGYAKAVWNFSLTPQGRTGVELATETRVLCLDEVSRQRFRLYWLLIRRLSGLIRREVLHSIKREAESAWQQRVA